MPFLDWCRSLLPDSALRARKKRLAVAPRAGSAAADALVESVLRGGRPAVLEAYFFRSGCAPDFYLFRDPAEFHAIATRFRGDNPELRLYPGDALVVKEQLVSGQTVLASADLLAKLEGHRAMVLQCTRAGEEVRYQMADTDEELATFAAQDWSGWDIAGCDLAEDAESVVVLPRLA